MKSIFGKKTVAKKAIENKAEALIDKAPNCNYMQTLSHIDENNSSISASFLNPSGKAPIKTTSLILK